MKEIDPVGGGAHGGGIPPDPPMIYDHMVDVVKLHASYLCISSYSGALL